jgi:ATP-dependent exoDNAse (exonuclease V) beta subunit
MLDIINPDYTRVTEVLSIFQHYAFIPRDRLKKAQDTGHEIHAAIEAYFREEFMPVACARTPYIDSFMKWVEGKKFDIKVIEERFYDHELMVTGRIDLLAEIDGKLFLIDFKTGSMAHPKIWRLQGTFYRTMILKNIGIEVENFVFVQLQKEGSFPILHEMKYCHDDLRICAAAVEAYSWFKE